MIWKYSINAKQYAKVLSLAKAPRVLEVRADGYCIEWLDLPPCRDAAAAWLTCQNLHHTKLVWPADIDAFTDYIRYRASKIQVELPGCFDAVMEMGVWDWAGCVHGDATMENFLEGGVMIDPGHPRGMPVVQCDRGKLLQSLVCHWEVVKRGWEPYTCRIPFTPTYEDVLMLWCHLVRLVAHNDLHSEKVREYGRLCLVAVREVLDTSHLRRGRCAVRLDQLRARLLQSSLDTSSRLRATGEYDVE